MKLTESTQAVATVPPNFRDRVSARIKKASYKEANKKGNPMITLECEIVHPSEVKIDGQSYILDSQEFSLFMILKDERKGKMPQSFLAAALDVNERLGLKREFDTDTLAAQCAGTYEGIIFDILLSSSEDLRQRINPETGEYEAILGEDNKPMSRGFKWNAQLGEVLGLTTDKAVLEANRQVPQ